MDTTTTPREYTTHQAAERLGISYQAVWWRIQHGYLPARRIGRDYLIAAADLDAMPAGKRRPGPPPRPPQADRAPAPKRRPGRPRKNREHF